MHRCVFTVWALPVEKLDVPAQAGCPVAGFMFNAQAIGKAKLTATFVAE